MPPKRQLLPLLLLMIPLCALGLQRSPALEGFPSFAYDRVLIDPARMAYKPTGEMIFPSVIKASDCFARPLGKYYLYYAPHDNPGGICLAYADNLEGPWTEHSANPVIPNAWPPHFKVAHTSSPHAFWNREAKKLYLYFHGENDVTRVASSTDGITFTYEKVCLTRADFERVSEVSYARVFEHTLPSKGNRYTMLLMCNHGSNPGTRGIYLAWSDDCLNWTAQRTAIISPDATEGGQLSGAHFFPWKGKYYVVYHASSGNMHVTEVGPEFDRENHLGVFHDSMNGPPDNKRSAAPCFITEGDTLYMFYEAGQRGGTKIALATSALTAPAAPGRLTATARNSVQIDLAWADHAGNETGFKLERATGAGGAFQEVAAVGADVISYSDTGLSGSVAYAYRVRANNGAGASAPSNTASATTPAGGATLVLYSVPGHDGFVVESAVGSEEGRSGSGGSLRTGDDKDKQLKTILSFVTAAIPSGATVVSATLRLKKSGGSGGNPFDTLGTCAVDIKGGAGFGDAPSLTGADFQAAADATEVVQLSRPMAENGNVATGALSAAGLRHINATGPTQFRVYFPRKHDGDGGNDYLAWHSGEASAESDRPVLELSYLSAPRSASAK